MVTTRLDRIIYSISACVLFFLTPQFLTAMSVTVTHGADGRISSITPDRDFSRSSTFEGVLNDAKFNLKGPGGNYEFITCTGPCPLPIDEPVQNIQVIPAKGPAESLTNLCAGTHYMMIQMVDGDDIVLFSGSFEPYSIVYARTPAGIEKLYPPFDNLRAIDIDRDMPSVTIQLATTPRGTAHAGFNLEQFQAYRTKAAEAVALLQTSIYNRNSGSLCQSAETSDPCPAVESARTNCRAAVDDLQNLIDVTATRSFETHVGSRLTCEGSPADCLCGVSISPNASSAVSAYVAPISLGWFRHTLAVPALKYTYAAEQDRFPQFNGGPFGTPLAAVKNEADNNNARNLIMPIAVQTLVKLPAWLEQSDPNYRVTVGFYKPGSKEFKDEERIWQHSFRVESTYHITVHAGVRSFLPLTGVNVTGASGFPVALGFVNGRPTGIWVPLLSDSLLLTILFCRRGAISGDLSGIDGRSFPFNGGVYLGFTLLPVAPGFSLGLNISLGNFLVIGGGIAIAWPKVFMVDSRAAEWTERRTFTVGPEISLSIALDGIPKLIKQLASAFKS